MSSIQYLVLLLIVFICGCKIVHQRAHSHNDYLQSKPLLDALALGFVSVEADVLLKDSQLYVGHNRSDVEDPAIKDLEELYLEPLFNRFNQYNGHIYKGHTGLFYLWIDIKYEGEEVFGILQEVIEPYEEMLFSERLNNKGKVMLILSGDRPFNLVLAATEGYLHLDGRPDDLAKEYSSEKMPFISQHIKYVCQTNAQQFLDDSEFEKLLIFVKSCHREHKKVRLWATPENEQLWTQLIKANVDLINTDSLHKLTNFLHE